MSDLDLYRQLRSWAEGRPLPTLEALPFRRPEAADTLILAFVRMAGETTPWGFAAGRPGEQPRIHVIAEPRNADQVARLCVALASELLPHTGHPDHAPEASFDPAARQLWLPGPAHVDLLHLLALRFAWARKGAPATVAALQALARAAGFLFRESSRPGQGRVIDACAALRSTFSFAAEPSRCAHLGYLLAWLQTPGGREARMAAAAQAEAITAGVNLDPALERDYLQAPVKAWGEATRAGDRARAAQAARAIEALLRPELERRWAWACEAWQLLQDDPRPENTELCDLDAITRDEYASQYLRIERVLLAPPAGKPPFVPDPETDRSGPAATARYFASLHASDVRSASLPHGDDALVAQALASGDAIAGTLVRVEVTRVGRGQHIVCHMEAPAADLCRLRVGSKVCQAGQAGRTAVVRSIDVVGATRVFRVEIPNWKNARDGLLAASDLRLQGCTMALIPSVEPYFSRERSQQAWTPRGPGAWLTHGKGSPPSSRAPADGASLLKLVDSLG